MPICSSCGFPMGKSANCLPTWWKSGFKKQRGQIPLGSTVFAQLSQLRMWRLSKNNAPGLPVDSISVRTRRCERTRKKTSTTECFGPFEEPGETGVVKSNAETGEGYSDIHCADPDRVGIVIELKYAEDGNLESSCKAALAQIEDRKYGEGLKRRGVKKLLKYGIAFCEKECMVAMHKKGPPASVSFQGYPGRSGGRWGSMMVICHVDAL